MKKIKLLAILIIFLLMKSVLLFAEDGAGQTGITISFGYDGYWFVYKEMMGREILDKDTGWISGGFLELRGDTRFIFMRINADISGTNTATYSGSLQNLETGATTPYTSTTPELFLQYEMNIGFKLFNFSAATVAPYAAVGYRDWIRGQNRGYDYQEDYTWWYGAIGLNLAYSYDDWRFVLDGAVEFTINPTMTTNMGGRFDGETFYLKSRPGFRVEVSIQHTIYKNNSLGIFVFGTSYYQRWNIGASNDVMLTRGGAPVIIDGHTIYAFEPKSSTDIYGFRLGIGINF